MNTTLEKIRYFGDQITAKLDGCESDGKLSDEAAESILLLSECIVSALHAHLYFKRAVRGSRHDQ